MGEERRAVRRARLGLEAGGGQLLNLGLAGPCARWYLSIRNDLGTTDSIDNLFRTQVRGIARRDAADQAEIGLAALSDEAAAVVTLDEISNARSTIPNHLPEATWTQLRRLGLKKHIEAFIQWRSSNPSCEAQQPLEPCRLTE